MAVAEFTGSALEWNTFVAGRPGATYAHLHGWFDVIRRVFGHECLPLAALTDGRIEGVLPLVRVKSRLFGDYLVSMPFVNSGGPVGAAAAVRALAEYANAWADARGIGLVELRSTTALPLDWAVSHRKITVVLPLTPGDPEAVWRALPSKVRSQVRRPQKEGATVRFGPAEVGPFFEIFARHMRDLGTPTQSRRYFESIVESLGEAVTVACVYLGDQAVAGGLGFRWGTEFEITWASSLATYNRVAPNMLLYWALMERAAQAGATRFNFGRCTPGGGTHRFKRQWGAEDEQLWWYQAARTAGAAPPSPDQSAYAWGPRLWKRLPVSVATALGPAIVRGIP